MNACGSQGTMSLYTIHGAWSVTTTLLILLYIISFRVGIMLTMGIFLYDTSRLTRSAVLNHIRDEMSVPVRNFASSLFPVKAPLSSRTLFSPKRAHRGTFSGLPAIPLLAKSPEHLRSRRRSLPLRPWKPTIPSSS